MNPRDTMTTMPSSELRAAMYRARTAGRKARRSGFMDEAALWAGLLSDLDAVRKLRREGST